MTDDRVNDGDEAGDTATSLLARIKKKDPEGWRRFVHLYSPLIFRWCRQSGLKEADAADVGQEVFQAVSRAVAKFEYRQKNDSFRGWLRTITRNKIRDWVRRSVPGGEGVGGEETLPYLPSPGGDVLPDADDASAADDELMLMRRAVEMVLAEYSEPTRQAFCRLVVGDEKPADVAAALSMSVNAVYLLKSRIKRRIREEFEGLLESI